ncbi:MAG: hypothetical protein Q9202_006438 [Teloschistes flavicans]
MKAGKLDLMALKILGNGEASYVSDENARVSQRLVYKQSPVPTHLTFAHYAIYLIVAEPTFNLRLAVKHPARSPPGTSVVLDGSVKRDHGRKARPEEAPPRPTMDIPSISLRKHYRTVPGDPSEPTSTVVLTSPRSHFVDIRVFKRRPDQDTFLASTDDASLGELQWAFAGRSSSYHDSDERRFSSWEHWVDSGTDEPAEDKGEMISLENGDVLERGETRDEKTGKVEQYEELWTEMALVTPDSQVENVCVVLEVEEDNGRARGMVVRIGGWCQGILKKGQSVTVERWRWDGGKWQSVVSLGESELPCKDVVEKGNYEEGREILSGGLKWRVVECKARSRIPLIECPGRGRRSGPQYEE